MNVNRHGRGLRDYRPTEKHNRFSRPLHGFTLVELLVVIAIIGILVAVLLPAIQAARSAARRAQCLNHIKQLGIAAHNYADTHKTFPYGCIEGGNRMSVFVRLLPFMEQQAVHDQIDLTVGWDWGVNLASRQTLIPDLICPDKEPTTDWIYTHISWTEVTDNTDHRPTHYYGVMGAKGTNAYAPPPNNVYPPPIPHLGVGGYATNGILVKNEAIEPRRVSDGLSNTFLFGEMSWEMFEYDTWMGGISPGEVNAMNLKNVAHPLNSYHWEPASGFIDLNDTSFGSLHPSRGAHIGMADGSGHFFSEDAELRVLKALASRDQAEIVSADEVF